jgi:hypothetical protein
MHRQKNPFATKRAPKAPEQPPAPRRFDLEAALDDAMTKRVRVELRYEHDWAVRGFEPTAVYWTSKQKVCVSGVQVSNANDPMDQSGPHNFEVGRITALALTDIKFVPDPRFNRFDAKYRHGIISSV